MPDDLAPDLVPYQERATDAHSAPGVPTVEKGKAQTFDEWRASLPQDVDMNEVLTNGDDYAERIGLPMGVDVEVDFTVLAWERFRLFHQAENAKRRTAYADAGKGSRKRSRDWPMEYRRAIERNTGGLWAFTREGAPYLTTTGRQLAIACELLTTKP